jgi:hypothetical protein
MPSPPLCFCDVITPVVIHHWAHVVATNAMRVSRVTLVWFLMCNDMGTRERHGGPVEIVMSIELGIGGMRGLIRDLCRRLRVMVAWCRSLSQNLRRKPGSTEQIPAMKCQLVINYLFGEILPEGQRGLNVQALQEGRNPRIIRDWMSKSKARAVSLSPLFFISEERTLFMS